MTDTIIDRIFEKDILEKLRGITTVDAFLNDVSVLDGFLIHYVKDLHEGADGLSFPCVAAQFSDDLVEAKSDGSLQGVISRTVKLIGAVSVTDRSIVNRKLNTLVFDVRKTLAYDKFNATAKRNTEAKSIEVGGCRFDLPDNTDQYAYFEMTITINYVENWK